MHTTQYTTQQQPPEQGILGTTTNDMKRTGEEGSGRLGHPGVDVVVLVDLDDVISNAGVTTKQQPQLEQHHQQEQQPAKQKQLRQRMQCQRQRQLKGGSPLRRGRGGYEYHRCLIFMLFWLSVPQMVSLFLNNINSQSHHNNNNYSYSYFFVQHLPAFLNDDKNYNNNNTYKYQKYKHNGIYNHSTNNSSNNDKRFSASHLDASATAAASENSKNHQQQQQPQISLPPLAAKLLQQFQPHELPLQQSLVVAPSSSAASDPAPPVGHEAASATVGIVVAAGLVKDTSEIRDSTLSLLEALQCHYNVSILLLTRNESAGFGQRRKEQQCAPMWIHIEENNNNNNSSGFLSLGRIAKISHLRDQQRKLLETIYFKHASKRAAQTTTTTTTATQEQQSNTNQDLFYSQSVVILLDFDIFAFPTADQIMQRVKLIQSTTMKTAMPITATKTTRVLSTVSASLPSPPLPPGPSVICAAGRIAYMDPQLFDQRSIQRKEGYYDLFATVYWNDTYAMTMKTAMPTTSTATTKQQQEGKSVWHLRQIKQLANSSSSSSFWNMAPMRSGFSGLSLYRASVYFAPQCQYQMHLHDHHDTSTMTQHQTFSLPSTSSSFPQLPPWLSHYKVDNIDLPCEHIMFHECLHRHVFATMTMTTVDKDNHHSSSSDPLFFTNADHRRHLLVDPSLITYWKPPMQPKQKNRNKNRNQKMIALTTTNNNNIKS